MTSNEERSVHTYSESFNNKTRIVKNQFNFNQIIHVLEPKVMDYFSTYLCIKNI